MEIKVRNQNKITLIDLEGTELDHKTTNSLLEKLSNFIENDKTLFIAVNFEKITWLTSSGIGALLNIRKNLNKDNGELCLYNINKNVLESIKVLMIDRILPVYNSEEDAIEYLKNSPTNKVQKIYEVRKIDDETYIIDVKEKQIDLQNAGEIEIKSIELIEQVQAKNIIINFEKVTFITSSGIGALLSIYNCANNNDAQFCIYNVNSDIMEALSISMVDRILNITETENEAIDLLKSQIEI